MKIFESRERKESYSVVVKRTCDICGATSNRADWESGYYEVAETEVEIKIRQKEGSNYPDNGSGTEIQIDLCPKCFKDKFIPWLQSQGATIHIDNWDW